MTRAETTTGGREATGGVIPGRWAISVGKPESPAPEGFEWKLLTELARLESGHTPSRKKPEYWGGAIPWIGVRDATGNHGLTIFDTRETVTRAGIENSSARVLPPGTVCLSRTASVGYVVMMGRSMATSQDFVNWVCGPRLNPRYLKYILQLEQESIRRFAHGTTHQTMYYPEAKALHVCVPSREGQDAIAGALGALDDLIEVNRKLIANLVELAQALYHWAIADGATSTTVEAIATFENNKRVPLSAAERFASPGAYPYYGASGQMDSVGGYLFDGVRVLIGEDGSVVRANGTPVVQFVDGRFWVNNHAHVLLGRGISTSLLRIVLESANVAAVVTGAVQPKLSMGNLKSVPVKVPNDPSIDSAVQRLAEAELALREENRQLELTRDELLPLLMSGRVRVGDVAA